MRAEISLGTLQEKLTNFCEGALPLDAFLDKTPAERDKKLAGQVGHQAEGCAATKFGHGPEEWLWFSVETVDGPPLWRRWMVAFIGASSGVCVRKGLKTFCLPCDRTGVADDALQGTQWATKLQAIRSHADSLEIAAGIFFFTVTQASVRNWHKFLEFQSFRWDDDL